MADTFVLRKMKAELKDQTPVYSFEKVDIELNTLLGYKLKIDYTGKIFCLHCNKVTKKSFAQGYCYSCFIKIPETDICIMKPELCHHANGTCRDNEFAERHCFIDHVVYLSWTSGLKVGITRAHQKLTRWIDQGAVSAVVLGTVANRFHAGCLEVEIAKNMADKTNWRQMLKLQNCSVNLLDHRERICASLSQNLMTTYNNDAIQMITYPVLEYPAKITSHTLEKSPTLEGTLLGIKGQYLILDTGVINIRNHGGYEVRFSTSQQQSQSTTYQPSLL